MAAAAGASGARSWLQARHMTWLTPKRMRAATLAFVRGCVRHLVVRSQRLYARRSWHARSARFDSLETPGTRANNV